MCWGYLPGIIEIISLPSVAKPSLLELVSELSNEILTVFKKSYIQRRPEIKSKKHDRAVYCLSRLTKVSPLIDLIWLDWWATPLFWKLERIIHFKSSHPQNTSNSSNWAFNAVWAPEQWTQMSARLPASVAQQHTCFESLQWGEESGKRFTQETNPHWEEEAEETCLSGHQIIATILKLIRHENCQVSFTLHGNLTINEPGYSHLSTIVLTLFTFL